MDFFMVAQVVWDTFLLFILSFIVSVVISYAAYFIFGQEKVESFLNKYGI